MSVFLLGTGLRALMHGKLGAQVDSWGGAMLPASFAGEEGCRQGMCQAGSVFLVHTSLEQPQSHCPCPQLLMGDGLSLRRTWGFNTAQAKFVGSVFSWETSPVPFGVWHGGPYQKNGDGLRKWALQRICVLFSATTWWFTATSK